MKINSNHLKTAVMHYFRFKYQCLVCTEYPINAGNADVMAYDLKRKALTEVEVKISKSDFKADFKKEKHVFMRNKSNRVKRFYFCVPVELKDFAMDELANRDEAAEYGLMIFDHTKQKFVYDMKQQMSVPSGLIIDDPYALQSTISVVKRAKVLHKEPVELNHYIPLGIVKRSQTELLKKYYKRHFGFEK